MAGISNDASLHGKVRAVAKKNGLRAQEVLQMYLFEHLLLGLAASPYSDRFVLKGGLLISSMIGLAQRTTWTWTRPSSACRWTGRASSGQ